MDSEISSDEEGEFISGEDFSSENEKGAESSDEEEKDVVEDNSTIYGVKERLRELFNTKNVSQFLRIANNDEAIDDYIEASIRIVKNFDRIEYLNVELISLAALFDVVYQGVINEKNVTSFVKLYSQQNPFNIIRYIQMYNSKK